MQPMLIARSVNDAWIQRMCSILSHACTVGSIGSSKVRLHPVVCIAAPDGISMHIGDDVGGMGIDIEEEGVGEVDLPLTQWPLTTSVH